MANYLDISAALDKALDAFNTANPVTVSGQYSNQPMDIAWENQRYEPVVGRPWQEATVLPAQTTQPGNGVNGVRYDSGIYQVTLYYPRDEGAGGAAGRADLLRSYFKRGTSLSHNGVTVLVERTPSISPARISASWYQLVVSIPYFIYS